METLAANHMNKDASFSLPRILKGRTHSLELRVWLALLVFCNYSLLHGHVAEVWVFQPSLVAEGQWYRALLSPFVHVSWYHLLLDASAFLLLWKGLDEENSGSRWVALFFSWAGSLVAPLFMSEQVYSLGLCGLSGICHGLFAATALEMAFNKKGKQACILGLGLFAGLSAKVAREALTGAALLAGVHTGWVGTPLVSSHFGGFLGGCAAMGLVRLVRVFCFRFQIF